ncbi:hypothetical protein V565_001850 [Rhizoctonia solani 123E]|uniref:Uncharacterized protein n=1 Tax=Rhizoctonia solani 123E TaxID=1423351 RepID=A0A074SG34_9AGAM|nr:hypothetical protein V565_001850 [Rhizoctonia solani 123E]
MRVLLGVHDIIRNAITCFVGTGPRIASGMNVARNLNTRPHLTNNSPSRAMLPSNVCIAEPGDPEPDTLMEPQDSHRDVAESGSGPTDSSIDAPRYSGESSANQFEDVSVVNAFKPHHLSTNNTPSEHSKCVYAHLLY